MADIGFSADKVTIIVEADDRASDKLGKIGGSLDTLGKTGTMIAGAGLAAVGAGVAAVGGIISQTVPRAMDFEQAMRNVNAIAQLNEGEFQNLSKDVLDFSMTTRASASDVAGSLYNVVSAGFDAAEGFDIMKASSRAAGAGLADTTSTSQLLIAALRSYQMPVTEAERVTDVFLQTVNEGITTLPELASGLGRILPAASSLGVPLEEVGFSIGRMTQTGLSTDEALTRLQATFVGMLNPSEQLQEAVEELGYTSGYDLVQQSGGALNALRILKEEGYLDTTEEVSNMFNNVRALGGVLALTTDETTIAADAVTEFGERAEGAVGRAREQQYASFSAQVELLKSKFEVIAIKVGTAVLPILGTLGELITTHVVPAVETLAGIWEKVWEWLSKVITNITEFGWTLEDLFTTFEDGSTIWDGFFQALGFGEEKSKEFGRAINDVAGFLRDLWTKVSDVARKLWEFLEPVRDWIQENIELKDVLIALGIIIGTVIISALISIATTLAPVIALVGGLILAVNLARRAWEEDWNGIRTKLTEVWNNTLKPALEDLYAWLKENIPIAIDVLKNWWETKLVPAMEAVWEFIEGDLIPIFEEIWEWLSTTIPEVIATVMVKWGEFRDKLDEVWAFISEYVIPIFQDVADIIMGAVHLAIVIITGLWINFKVRVLEPFWEFMQNSILPILQDVANWLDEHLSPAVETVSGWFDTFKVSISPIAGILTGIHKWLSSVADVLARLPDNLPSWLTSFSPTPFERALRGINSALIEVNPNLEKFNAIANATSYTGVGFNMPGRGNNETHYHYHLGVNSTQSNRRVIDDFNLMRAMAG